MPSNITRQLPRGIINMMRGCRYLALLALEPLDYLMRLAQGKRDFPPLRLRRYVGPLRTFESSGTEFICYLRMLANLRHDTSFLDIGCGCGLLAIYLKEYLSKEGRYLGLDIDASSIRWCQRRISEANPTFQFKHMDVRSLAYNPRGRYTADNYTLPAGDTSYDLVLLKSVFTHMHANEIDHYLAEIARVLRPEGCCLATFFLLNHEQKRLAAEGRNMLDFAFGDEQCRHVYEHSPESAIAYNEAFIMQLLAKHGLSLLKPVVYGRWSGRDDGLSYQDMMLITPARTVS